MVANPYIHYRKVQIETADQGRLLLMLYDGALKFLNRALLSLQGGNLQNAHNNLLRVQDIIFELMAALDLRRGEVAASLYSLYEYMHFLLVEANVKKEIEPVYQVEQMLLELREVWKKSLEGSGPPGNEAKVRKEFHKNEGAAAEKSLQDQQGQHREKKISAFYENTEGIQGEKDMQSVASRVNVSG